ncbi:N-terminal acetyltransferase B complex catalytic subunit [Nematocida homosporus]|uniref:N-terminal acetyltransferase B complex catalytic subunit n=1 Tax=Nematocida homosporus TaxID=1912981 RepID=UPI00221E79A8|nr:N-terminal acetyltransferase B complex catalytic subunit [Nematocida homosporus]KAI5184261.1 N-terminal acetyltransferase B complex catalytic subunit [Nematocida homosporus]
MFVYDELTALDLLDVNLVNLDAMTASFSLEFYTSYFESHNQHCMAVKTDGSVVGYLFGSTGKYMKSETKYAHVTALSIAPTVRKCCLGSGLMELFERNASEEESVFIDLFVRCSNKSAIAFYTKHGYGVHKQVPGYYIEPAEDGYDMRKYLKGQVEVG